LSGIEVLGQAERVELLTALSGGLSDGGAEAAARPIADGRGSSDSLAIYAVKPPSIVRLAPVT